MQLAAEAITSDDIGTAFIYNNIILRNVNVRPTIATRDGSPALTDRTARGLLLRTDTPRSGRRDTTE